MINPMGVKEIQWQKKLHYCTSLLDQVHANNDLRTLSLSRDLTSLTELWEIKLLLISAVEHIS